MRLIRLSYVMLTNVSFYLPTSATGLSLLVLTDTFFLLFLCNIVILVNLIFWSLRCFSHFCLIIPLDHSAWSFRLIIPLDHSASSHLLGWALSRMLLTPSFSSELGLRDGPARKRSLHRSVVIIVPFLGLDRRRSFTECSAWIQDTGICHWHHGRENSVSTVAVTSESIVGRNEKDNCKEHDQVSRHLAK